MSVFYDFGQGTGGANLENWLAPNYDPSVEWKKGQYCVYLGVLKQCLAPTTGVFDESKWKDDFLINKSGGGSGSDSFEFIAKEYDPAETHDKGEIALYGDETYVCLADGTTGAWDASKWKRTYLANASNGMSIDGLEPELLWTNTSPTASFSARTISLNLSEYEGVIIETMVSTDVQKLGTRVYLKKTDTYSGTGLGQKRSGRDISVTDSGVKIGTCYYGESTFDANVIPFKIYGVKKVVVETVNPISEVVTFGSTGGSSINVNTGVVTKLEGNITVDTEHTHYASGVLTVKDAFSCKLYTDGVLSEKTYAVGENIGTTGVSVNRVLIIQS